MDAKLSNVVVCVLNPDPDKTYLPHSALNGSILAPKLLLTSKLLFASLKTRLVVVLLTNMPPLFPVASALILLLLQTMALEWSFASALIQLALTKTLGVPPITSEHLNIRRVPASERLSATFLSVTLKLNALMFPPLETAADRAVVKFANLHWLLLLLFLMAKSLAPTNLTRALFTAMLLEANKNVLVLSAFIIPIALALFTLLNAMSMLPAVPYDVRPYANALPPVEFRTANAGNVAIGLSNSTAPFRDIRIPVFIRPMDYAPDDFATATKLLSSHIWLAMATMRGAPLVSDPSASLAVPMTILHRPAFVPSTGPLKLKVDPIWSLNMLLPPMILNNPVLVLSSPHVITGAFLGLSVESAFIITDFLGNLIWCIILLLLKTLILMGALPMLPIRMANGLAYAVMLPIDARTISATADARLQLTVVTAATPFPVLTVKHLLFLMTAHAHIRLPVVPATGEMALISALNPAPLAMAHVSDGRPNFDGNDLGMAISTAVILSLIARPVRSPQWKSAAFIGNDNVDVDVDRIELMPIKPFELPTLISRLMLGLLNLQITLTNGVLTVVTLDVNAIITPAPRTQIEELDDPVVAKPLSLSAH